METYYLAIDIGASSGRHVLGHMEEGQLKLQEVYRFDNRQVRKNGHDCWDLDNLWAQILAGMCACREAGKAPSSVGIDTWAVDFVLLGQDGRPVSDAVAYRDKRTDGMRGLLEPALPFAEHYARTGIQYQPFNTVYQLLALQREHPEQMAAARHFLMIPDYFHYLLSGKIANEYTNATSTALLNARSKRWDTDILSAMNVPAGLFQEPSLPGTVLGQLTQQVQQAVGFDCKVMLPATHDTASAFMAVPAQDDDSVYISSGTWSLLGVENREPITTPESRAQNFTNEGGYAYRFRYLKNIMGLWMIQSIRRELNGVAYVQGKAQCTAGEKQWSFAQLEQAARDTADFSSVVQVDAPRFLSPDSMMAQVRAACRESGQPVPDSVGQLMQCVYRSLAQGYRDSIRNLSLLTGKPYRGVHIVGGGSKDGYLNALTARESGLPVYAGPTEGTAVGNLMAQMLHDGVWGDLREARACVARSFPVHTYLP